MKTKMLILSLVMFLSVVQAFAGAPAESIAWWQEARFGMFIHWGLYAIPARGEWLMYQEHVPVAEYSQLAQEFNPQAYRPDEWVQLAQSAGMKYVVLTTRHHDGFCLFDSKTTAFTAPKTAAGRDLIAEFVAACRRAKMRFGFYYSLVNWRFPGILPITPNQPDSVYLPMIEQAHAQIRELCSQYGKVDILWYDMLVPSDTTLWRARELEKMVRELQPEILINDRGGVPGDFATPENTISAKNRPWESCYSLNRTWGYAKYDQNFKSPHEILRLLATCVDSDGNFLLNVAPDANGTIQPEAVETLQVIGEWLKKNGAAIYGAGPSPIVAHNLGLATRAENNVYLLVQRWPGSPVPFAWCGSRVKSAKILTNGQSARIVQQGDRVWLYDLPETPPDSYLSVIELTFDGAPKASDPAYR
jgi:alpha-L-fucosidase